MPLNWEGLVQRYANGVQIQSFPGATPLVVTGADDQRIYISHRLWKASLSRANLEKAVTLLEQGKMVRTVGAFVEQYRTYVADERATSAAIVLKDLGYLE